MESLRAYVSLHRRFQDIDHDQYELSTRFPLDVRVPHEKIIKMPEFRVTLPLFAIDVKKVFLRFLFRARFLKRFFNVFFILPTFLFLKTFIENTI